MTVKERRDHWRALVEKHARSGLSGVAFCKEQNIDPQQFYPWRRRILRETATTEFIRLVPSSNTSRSGIRIHLDHGISIEVERGFDALALREIVDALRTKS
jgi:hypothetical protein